MRDIVLFGAGVYAKKYYSLLEYLDMDFKYFTDNNKSIHGQMLFGKEIIAPERLKDIDCNIIISCTHGESIRKQLKEMGIEDRIINIQDLYNLNSMAKTNDLTEKEKIPYTEDINVLIDMYEGIGWGGTEIWAANVAKSLYEKGNRVSLWGSCIQDRLEEQYEKHVIRFSTEHTIQEMVEKIKDNLPCVIINNFAGCMFIAAALVKARYPHLVKIISVIHNDNKSLYDAHMMIKDSIDAYVCVSEKIRRTIIADYNIEATKTYFKEQPIEYDETFKKIYRVSDEPLRIGYAARLVVQQKRADLFPDLIKALEKKMVNYVLEIAGDGDCLEQIHTYVLENKLDHKVKLLGRINKSEMPDFWRRQDVFLNFSEYEGTSLAMLEAMSNGCIPIVTDVSGAQEFIEQGKNGFICPVGALDEMAEKIALLDKNRELLSTYGDICRWNIKTRCNNADYTTYIEKVIKESW